MNSNLKELAESIPDFDEMINLADEIGELSFKKMQLENRIKAEESAIVAKVYSDVKYYVGGKPPSMSFIESTYKYTGLDGQLTQKREELAYVTSILEKSKLRLYIYKDMLEVFRTVSANERSVAI